MWRGRAGYFLSDVYAGDQACTSSDQVNDVNGIQQHVGYRFTLSSCSTTQRICGALHYYNYAFRMLFQLPHF